MSIDFEEYMKLETRNVSIVKREDLPFEFSDEAYKTIVGFIQKTRDLDYEWAIFFDYVTGEILKCVKGESDNVNVDFEEGEFEKYRVSSIHNHPINSFSPLRGKISIFFEELLKIMNWFLEEMDYGF